MTVSRLLRDNRGAFNLRTAFWIVILVVGVYSAYLAGVPYFTYRMLKYEVETEAKNARRNTDTEIRKHIMEKAIGWDIHIRPEQIDIDRRTNSIAISVVYKVEFNLFDLYKKDITYEAYNVQSLVQD